MVPNINNSPASTGFIWARFKRAAFIAVTITAIGSASVIFYALTPKVNTKSVVDFNKTRNYRQTPFDELDALQICQYQTREIHSTRLLTSYVDSHSSRFEHSTGVYKVFVFARIGEARDYDDAIIHCHINPHKHLIEHYQTVYPEKPSLISRAFKLFSA